MKTVLQNKDSAVYLVLYMAIELSQNKWKLGFSNGERNRIRTIDARDWICLLTEIEIAKQKLNCSSECRVATKRAEMVSGFTEHWLVRELIIRLLIQPVLKSVGE